jgi:hypothetical protein
MKTTKDKALEALERRADREVAKQRKGVWIGQPPNWAQVKQQILARLRAQEAWKNLPRDWNTITTGTGIAS